VVFVLLMATARTPGGSFVPSLTVLACLLLAGGLVVSRLPEPAQHLALGDFLADAGQAAPAVPRPDHRA